MSMRTLAFILSVASSLFLQAQLAPTALSADYSAKVIDEAPPADGLAPEIAARLGSQAVRVTRGESRTLCDIWLSKQWKLSDFEASADLLYPFQSGQLIGAIRFHRDGADFRDQEIEKGLYTLRYAQQPVDGAHVGTSLTRDFLLLVPAASDKDPGVMLYRPLTEASAEAAGTSHPAMLAMKKVQGDGKLGAIRENEEEDWWLVRLASKAKVGDKTKELPFDLVVVGIFNE